MNCADTIKACLSMEDVLLFYGFQPTRKRRIPCPLHNGQDANFSYRDRHFKCFVCNAHGSVIDFVMQLFDISFNQAIIRLSSDFGLGLTAKRPTTQEAADLIDKRRRRQREKAAFEDEYRRKAEEHRYLLNVAKFYPPVMDGEKIYVLPEWHEAVNRLPYLEYWLNENLGG